MKPSISVARRSSVGTKLRSLPVLPVSPLPPLYAAWMGELLAGPLPTERDATCDDCAMVSPTAPHGSANYFHPQTKCCAYLPSLPNFLVGGVLANHRPATGKGRHATLAQLQSGQQMSPLGLEATAVRALLYGKSENAFGHSQTLRCPYYVTEGGGLCGIWQHRNANCSTWFCKHERGAAGRLFWQALRQLLSSIEDELARWCLVKLNVGTVALHQLFANAQDKTHLDASQIDGRANRDEQRAMWGEWAGREAAFFVECGRLVNALTWEDVLAACGPTVQIYAQFAVEAYQKLMGAELPHHLKVGEFKMVQMDAEQCLVITYSNYDPITLSSRLLRVLGYFDGRPTTVVRQAIREQEHLTLNDALLRRLVDYGVLVSGD